MLLQLLEEMLTLIGGLIVVYFVYVLVSRKDDKPTTNPPTMAHTALRDLVERAVDEARKLPGLGGAGNAGSTQEGRNIAEQSYEDLLATAILNKVIEKFQREQVDGNSNVLLGKSSRTKYVLSESELGLDEGVEEGSSSLEPLSQDECSSDCSASHSRHARNHQEPLSLRIEERIEEVTTTYTSDEDHRGLDNEVLSVRSARRVPFPELGMDIIDPSQESSEDSQDEPDTPTAPMDLVSPIESWEENWLFQRKRAQAQPDAVAMLVPSSNADFKALIGDKDAEDTSDLSECSSAQSDEEIEQELIEAINNVVPRSPKRSESDVENFLEDLRRDDLEISSRRKSSTKVSRTETKMQNGREETKENFFFSSGKVSTMNEMKMANYSLDFENESSPEVEDVNEMNDKSREMRLEIEDISSSTNSKSKKDFESTKRRLEKIPSEGDSSELERTFSPEETGAPEVPKTPTPTPTRTSVTENGFDAISEEKNLANDEKVLNSLERAKKKLMNAEKNVERSAEDLKNDCHLVNGYKGDFQVEDEDQQESEYTEHYDIATQRHLDSLTKTDISGNENSAKDSSETETEPNKCREAVAFAKAESASYQTLKKNTEDENVQLATPPRPGTIAEREHKKWENAPPIENNPYSEESIQRRLLERQYSRRSSDIPGVHAELPKSNGAEVDIVLEPNQPDIKRFGRDYYINDSKASRGERTRRSSTSATANSRPGSSQSQRSNSTAAEQEQQEETPTKDLESPSARTSDVKSKVARWQKNNLESSQYQKATGKSAISNNIESTEETFLKRNVEQKTWEDQKDILENERKNSKNEINAKLNNQDNFGCSSIIDAKKSNSENQRKIRRIDLKAYGFENDFCSRNTSIKTQRVVNKLDLKSFGYDGGLRRTQSNNQIDRTVNDADFRPRVVRVTNKSNLRKFHCKDLGSKEQGSGDFCLTKSSEALNKLPETFAIFGRMTSAKSVPNITESEYFDKDDSGNQSSECESGSLKQENEMAEIEKNEDSLKELEKVVEESSKGQSEEPVKDQPKDQLKDQENEQSKDQLKDQPAQSKEKLSVNPEEQVLEEKLESDKFIDKKLPLPSVRKLAETFSKQPEPAPAPLARTSKVNNSTKDRSSTPEIHIVETPKQMHSLTARSLSKQFREGLRQIPMKVASPPASHGAVEQITPEVQPEATQSNGEKTPSDTDVISPGKLKSNIMFWEEMQRRS